MKVYWTTLSDRDRLVLLVGSVIFIAYLLYLIIYNPLIHAVDLKSRQWVDKKETLIWMRNQVKTVHLPKTIESNLLTVFSDQLKHASFAQFPYQLQQAGEGHVQLSFEQVPYVELMRWLRKINQHYTMAITELAVVRSQTSGVVKLRLVVASQGKGS